MRSAQRVWSCTTLSITPLFFLFFIRLIFMPKAQTPYIINFLPEDLLLSSRKNSFEKRGTALSLPIHKMLIFWTHRKGQKTSSAPSFPIWLASLPRLKIRELASVLTLVSRYTLFWQNNLNFSIGSAFVAVCDSESILLNHQQIH